MQTDHFASNASEYARFRPHYPSSLIEWVCGKITTPSIAWDCGTGNGQVAIELAKHFERVIASDISEEQIKFSKPHPRVEYQVCSVEDAMLAADSINLVTVAEALHWFNLTTFYAKLQKIMKTNGLFACWSYENCHVSPSIDQLLATIKNQELGSFWPSEAKSADVSDVSMPEGFTELNCPPMSLQHSWSARDMIGYINSWSAVPRYRQQTKNHNLEGLFAALSCEWGKEPREVTWPLTLRVAIKD